MSIWSNKKSWTALALLLTSAGIAAGVRHGGLSVEYTDARDRAQLGVVFRAWDGAARDLRTIGLKVPAEVSIEAAGSAAGFAAQTGEPAGIAASTRGSTIYTQRLSALATRGLLPFTIRHEAFHTAQPARLTRWLAEGLARTFSGEAVSDPPGPTGLESLPDAALNAQLLQHSTPRLNAAYHEATRRAGLLVRQRGWRAVLGL
ncbi:hypothetical protein MF271_17735 (plasmid) [Deinococcus sp. KNUC1210]|uniref:hypothetical protein n=1 Tax=Deinococcus sp. KNUC1210 TaxID=2917691 RepID=UPI001EF03CDF|nr:hypothetical protein [Deinococcus sp. KNUC1210]ULH17202.1 hypothetical protein MF271_17735 [Deinococcus sp. KNUC1210]